MISGALALFGTLLSILWYEIQKSDANARDPVLQNQKRYEAIDEAIAARKPDTGAADDLDTLARLRRDQGHQQ